MRRGILGAIATLVLAAPVARGQGLFVQLGAVGASGADYAFRSSHPGLIAGALVGAGWQARTVAIRLDARVFDTEAEPLLIGGVTATWDAIRRRMVHGYALVTAGTGAFLAEGDPGHHAGIGAGLRATSRLGWFAEFRLDRLLGTFTYASRERTLASITVGIRLARH